MFSIISQKWCHSHWCGGHLWEWKLALNSDGLICRKTSYSPLSSDFSSFLSLSNWKRRRWEFAIQLTLVGVVLHPLLWGKLFPGDYNLQMNSWWTYYLLNRFTKLWLVEKEIQRNSPAFWYSTPCPSYSPLNRLLKRFSILPNLFTGVHNEPLYGTVHVWNKFYNLEF